MSTSQGAAAIDRRTADAARRVLQLMLGEWRLLPEGWEEIAELLDELAVAVAAGDATAVDALTGELEEFSGSRVSRIEKGPDGKVPLPEPDRERVVALVHTLAPDARPGDPPPAPPERT
ncbi:MAG: hypothetical protein H5T76_16260 [Streptomyces sp.]|nr:hypothetical protein [Streptomyces sp.]